MLNLTYGNVGDAHAGGIQTGVRAVCLDDHFAHQVLCPQADINNRVALQAQP